MKAWITISGTCVFRLYERSLGKIGYLTREERGREEEAITGLLPMWKLRWVIGDFAYYSVPVGEQTLAEHGYGPGKAPPPLEQQGDGEGEARAEDGWQRG